MARKNLAGYPTFIGDKKLSIYVHTGPVSYVQVVNAVPPTGGDTTTLAEAGMGSFDMVDSDMCSDDGQFVVQVISPNGNTAGGGTGAVPATTMKLRWITAATGAEVGAGVNLSARTIRLRAIGMK